MLANIKLLNHVSISCFFINAFTGYIEFLLIGASLGLFIFGYFILRYRALPKIFLLIIFVVIISYTFTLYNNGLTRGSLFIPLFISGVGVALGIEKFGLNYYYSFLTFYL